MTDDNVANIVARTGMSEAEARMALEKLSPQNRLIEPEEVATMVMLAGDMGGESTGRRSILTGEQ